MAYQNTKQFNYNLYQNIRNNNYAEAQRLIEIGLNELTFKFKDRRGFISLVLNFHIDQCNDDNIDQLIADNIDFIMKRDLLNCSKYYYDKNLDKSEIIFRKLITNYYFDNSCLDFILDNNMNYFLKYLDGRYLKTNMSENILTDYSNLKKYKFNKKIVADFKNKLKPMINFQIIKNIYSKVEELNGHNKLIIIDAGNILFSKGGKITVSGYNSLIETINYINSLNFIPILVIHNRHLKLKFKGELKNKNIINKINTIKSSDCIIVETPYNINDDFYIVYLSLHFECPIITNDNYKDHIFNFRSNNKSNMENIIESYIESNLVKYNFQFNKINFDRIYNFSKCIQLIDNKCIIPNDYGFIYIDL